MKRISRACRIGGLMAGVSLLVLAPDIALAQSGPVLEEIIVTARKREESLMSAPVAVTAFRGEDMDAQGITTLEQIAAGIPGLQLGRAAQTTNVFIRGIGSGVNKSFEQSVGMYIDGIYMPRSRQYSQAFLDLEQVEVIRGPQGTLFGKNTIAGAIKVTTVSPDIGEDLNGYLTVDFEPEYDVYRQTVAMTVPLGENWAMRIAGRLEETGGYTRNEIFNNRGQRRDNGIVRVTLVGEILDGLNVEAKFSYTDMEGEGMDATVAVFDPSLGVGLPAAATIGATFTGAIPGFQVADGNAADEWTSWVGNTRYGEDRESTLSKVTSLKLEKDVGRYTITGITGYSDFEFGQWHDVDFGPINLVHDDDGETLEQWSQEFRIASSYDGDVNFVAGAYWEQQDLFIKTDVYLDAEIGGLAGASGAFGPFDSFLDGLLFPVIAGPGVLNCAAAPDPAACQITAVGMAASLPNQIGRAPTFNQEAETYAIFGEITFDLTDTARLDIGGRYSKDTKDAHKDVALFFNDDPTAVFMSPDGTQTGLLDPLSSVLMAGVLGSSFGTFPHDQKISISESHADPSLRVSWDMTPESMVYLSYTQGYKSGGVNFSPDTANPDGSIGSGTTFEPETAKSWELGLRSTIRDGRLRVALTGFSTDFKDLQVTSFQGTTFVVGNAAESSSKGVEIETLFAFSENVELGASLAYLNNEYGSFEGAGCTIAQQAAAAVALLPDCSQDLTGRPSPFAPEISGKFFAKAHYPLGDNLEINARIDLNFKDDYYLSFDLDPTSFQDSYAKIDARISIAQIDGDWQLGLYGRNLTNQATYTFQIPNPLSAGVFSRWIEEPRVIGAQMSVRF